jgi:hypothetical protein
MSDPRQTHVFAVGISTYPRMGPDWRLPNAAGHALEFARWAHKRGVEAGQIHLFLSEDDRTRLAAIGPTGVAARRATHDAIERFVSDELPTLKGELLYVFWAGHGSMTEDGERVLFFEDLSSSHVRHFDLTDFFVRLRTSSFQRFTRQIAFVDACANRFEELELGASLDKVFRGKGRWSVGAVRQAFLLAADSGQQATAGVFGATVLEALEKQPEGVWPPDQDAVVSAVRERFVGADQRPVQLVWTTEQGDSYVESRAGDLPASTFVNAAARICGVPVRALRRLAAATRTELGLASEEGAARRRDAFAEVTAGAGRPDALPRGSPQFELLYLVSAGLSWKQDAILGRTLGLAFQSELDRVVRARELRRAIANVHAHLAVVQEEFLKTLRDAPNERDHEEVWTLDTIPDELYQRIGPLEPEQFVWEFLLRLAARVPGSRDALDAFIEERNQHDSERAAPVTLTTIRETLAREQRFVLSIDLHPADTEMPAFDSLDARLVDADTARLIHAFGTERITSWNDVTQKVAIIARGAREIVLNKFRRKAETLLVEFLMPSVFITEAPDRVPVRVGGASQLLGDLHAVVVRLRERIAQRHDVFCLDEWERAARRIDRHGASVVQWMDPECATPTIDTCAGLVGLKFFPTSNPIHIVNRGFPYMVWLHPDREKAGPNDPVEPPFDWEGFITHFDAWAKKLRLNDVPRDVRAMRRTSLDLGARLTLFWDDPDRVGHWILSEISIGAGR